jgi:hypothetical protein
MISLLQFESLSSGNTAPTSFHLQNFTLKDSIYTSSRSVLSTLNLENTADFEFRISYFWVGNLTFLVKGSLLELNHALVKAVVVEDSVFEGVNSGAITVINSPTSDLLVNKVEFKN